MRTTIVLILCGLIIVAGIVLLNRNDGSTTAEREPGTAAMQAEVYTCPMHPSVRSDRPGACPVCGMALVRVSKTREASSEEIARINAVSLSPVQRVMSNISTIEARRQTVTHEVRAVGVVDFAEPLQATVAARFGGRIERVLVNSTGYRVRKGEPLFTLYSPDLITAEREYLLALEGDSGPADHLTGSGHTEDTAAGSADLRIGESSRERLIQRFGLTAAQVDELRNSARVGSAAVFTSPISGTVIRKEIKEGQYVQEGSVLYELADLSRVWVLLDVYEQDIRFVRKGNDVALSVEAYPAENFRGRVVFLEPVVNPETRTVRVRIEVPNQFGKLRPNMYVSGKIVVRRDHALAVPRQAVLNTGRQSVVWVEVAKNTFEPRTVTTGVVGETFCEILTGLDGGEQVAVTGGFLIDSESALSAPEPAAPDESPSSSRSGKSAAGGAGTDVEIRVDGGYFPEVVHVPAGKTVRLHFTRVDNSECTREVVFKSLDIRRELPTGKTTTIEFTPSSPGEIRYECGMSMLEGKIIVDPR